MTMYQKDSLKGTPLDKSGQIDIKMEMIEQIIIH